MLETHLRNPLWRDKATRFDGGHTSIVKSVDEVYLDLCWYDRLFVLETISRAYFDDLDMVWVFLGRVCSNYRPVRDLCFTKA